MESYLMITQINDFIFCPRSIFFHNVFSENFDPSVFRETPQKVGTAVHRAVDEQRYSSRSDILQGITVYSEKYNLLGRIDIFDTASGQLTERKFSVTAVYPGFRYQLYAQYFALTEMGWNVRSLRLYSSKDNKCWPIPLPGPDEINAFEHTMADIADYSLDQPFRPNPAKCAHCNYRSLCDMPACAEETS